MSIMAKTVGTISGKITQVPSKDGLIIRFEGTWKQGNLTGTFILNKTCAKKEFDGTWKNDNGKESGTRVGSSYTSVFKKSDMGRGLQFVHITGCLITRLKYHRPGLLLCHLWP